MAEIIAYPKLEGSESFARAIIEGFIEFPKTEIVMEIPMSEQRLPAQKAYDIAAERISSYLEIGKNVVVLCEGDPFFMDHLCICTRDFLENIKLK